MRTLPVLTVLFVACNGGSTDGGLPLLGDGAHTPDAVTIEVVANAEAGLNQPTDIAVNPRSPGQWFITNFADNSIVRIHDGIVQGKFNAAGSAHFLASPSGIAFSDFGNFATAQDTDEETQSFTPTDFMGPTLWDDSDMFDGGHGGHLDMLHNSPLGGGIAWEAANVYWVVDGFHNSLTRYDFGDDHGYGGADHSDGIIYRYAEGSVAHSRGMPTHIDMAAGILFVADASGRVFSFDPSTAARGSVIGPDYDGAEMAAFSGGSELTLATGQVLPLLDENGNETVTPYTLAQPAGLEVHEGIIYVTDRPTGVIFAMTVDGELIDWLPTGRTNALGGLDFDAEGNILVVDQAANELLRITARDGE